MTVLDTAWMLYTTPSGQVGYVACSNVIGFEEVAQWGGGTLTTIRLSGGAMVYAKEKAAALLKAAGEL